MSDLNKSRPWYQGLFGADPVLDEDAAGFHHVVWLVLSRTSPPTQGACTRLLADLRAARPLSRQIIAENASIGDHDSLWMLPPD